MPFMRNVGTPQGDSLNPVLFTIYLENALREIRTTLPEPNSSCGREIPSEIAYADDVDFIGHDYANIAKIQESLEKYQLKVNTDKTEFTLLSKSEEDWKKVKKVGSLIDDNEDIERRKQLSSTALSRLNNLWLKDNKIKTATKIHLYKSLAVDKAYFAGTDRSGCNIVCSLARRNARQVDVWLFLEIPGIGCLQHPRHPDVDIHFTNGSTFSAGGLTFEVIEPMKTWKISFSGKLRKGLCNSNSDKTSEFVETSFSFIWKAFSPPFNLHTDMVPENVSREPKNSNILYQQWGELRGRLNVEGLDEQHLYLQCVRERLVGEKDWSMSHRYIVNHIYLQNVLSHVKSAINEQRPKFSTSRTLLLHDNAGPHKARATTQSPWELGIQVLPHPAYSPDLAPFDFWLFLILKDRLAGRKFDRIQDLAKAVNSELRTTQEEDYQGVFWK
ncbi:transposase [Elysia marginata]|uniref:Transposase n=1 Tax=Elysia marginata TaxID=1093978 RepID=A0AAV4HJ33_9GAST|nr:transposase [Elysia marginata]